LFLDLMSGVNHVSVPHEYLPDFPVLQDVRNIKFNKPLK
jgi:hypothetical protein